MLGKQNPEEGMGTLVMTRHHLRLGVFPCASHHTRLSTKCTCLSTFNSMK
jgi:hypothetical protein